MREIMICIALVTHGGEEYDSKYPDGIITQEKQARQVVFAMQKIPIQKNLSCASA